ncbi:hypothetical protein Pen01_27730 [Phytomonospora endophytica]|nr:hypothetical protein Pen01_27730 [Phytomonospora endophytica]
MNGASRGDSGGSGSGRGGEGGPRCDGGARDGEAFGEGALDVGEDLQREQRHIGADGADDRRCRRTSVQVARAVAMRRPVTVSPRAGGNPVTVEGWARGGRFPPPTTMTR